MNTDKCKKIVHELEELKINVESYIKLFKKCNVSNIKELETELIASLNSKDKLNVLREYMKGPKPTTVIEEETARVKAEEEGKASALANPTNLVIPPFIKPDGLIRAQSLPNLSVGGKPKLNVKYISTKTKTDVRMKSGSSVSRTIYHKEGDKKQTIYVKINSEYVKYNSKKKY
jgi:hypothetical protein